MAILITGGAGYIGSHTCIELLSAGYEIIIVDNFSNSKSEVLRHIQEISNRMFKFREISILDKRGLEKVFAENEIEAVIHFAGFKAVGESINIPLKYYHNNITGTLVLCEVMQKFGVKKIVFSSSATVYGIPKQVPISESFPLNATNPYGRTKLILEEIFNDLCISDKQWSIALLRYFNPVGAHKSGRIGEDPNGIPNNLMPYITQVAIGKRDKLHVFGGDYETHDGTGVRDYIHVVDLAKGHLMALRRVMTTTGIGAYNLGTGTGYSVLDMVRSFEEVTGQHIPYIIANRRPGDVARCFADVKKARDELGWTAERSINEMCEDAWRWQTNNPNGYDGEALAVPYDQSEIAAAK